MKYMNTRPWLRTKTLTLAVTAALLPLLPASGNAQQSATATAAAPASAAASAQASEPQASLAEIVVTAQFRTESLEKAPIAITAITGADIENRGITETTGLNSVAPNVNLAPSGSMGGKTVFAFIRGVGQNDFIFSEEPGVGFYVDGVYMGTAYGTQMQLMDLDRAEVLRGPEGTLFGKNTVGGAISLISKKPQGDDSGYLEAGAGSYNLITTRGMFDISLIPDELFLRVSGVSKHQDGYVKVIDFACANPTQVGAGTAPYTIKPSNPHSSDCQTGTEGSTDLNGARVALRWMPTSNFEMNLVGDYTVDNGSGAPDTLLKVYPGVFTAYNQTTSIPLYGIPYDSRFIPPNRYQTYATFNSEPYGVNFENVNDMTSFGVADTINWKFSDWASLTSISAWRGFSGAFGRDSDASPMATDSTFDAVTEHQFSEEDRLNGTLFDNTLEWTAGVYYLKTGERDAGTVLANLYGLFFAINDPAGVEDKAGFLHAIYHVTDKLSITAGLRYTDENKTYTFSRQDIPYGTPTSFWGPDGLLQSTAEHSSHLDYRGVIDYQWTDDVMTYAQISTGFRGGGFNPRPSAPSEIRPFAPETLTAYELGSKIQLFDNRLHINGDVFYEKYKDIQLDALELDPVTAFPETIHTNAGAARIEGAELEIQALLFEGFTLSAEGGYTDFRYTNLGAAAGLSGGPTLETQPVLTPKIKYSISADYKVPSPDAFGQFTLHGDWAWQAHEFNDAANSPDLEVGAYGIANARVNWLAPNKKWQMSVWSTNLGNHFFFYGKSYISGDGQVKGDPAPPREFGVTIRRNF
jgi:iron complex outermembrane recepter protein